MAGRPTWVLLLVLGTVVLAGCGGGGSSRSGIEAALLDGKVADIFSPSQLAGGKSPVCTASKTLPGDYDCSAVPILRPCTSATTGPCDSPLAPAQVWMQCFPLTSGAFAWSCTLVEPPPGTPVFTTPAQKAAPKHGIWLCRALNKDGERV